MAGDPFVSTTLADGSSLQSADDAWGPASSTYPGESAIGQPEVLP